MTSIILACLWGIAANIIALLPSKDNHWTYAYVLIGIGVPILGYVTWDHGPWIGLIALVAGMSMLRWPVIYLGRWIRKRVLG